MGFEDAPNRVGNRRGRNAEGIRPSEIEAREGENKGANLPPLLAAHLGRNENSQLLRSSLTFVQGGHQPLTNFGGNHPPNGSVTPFVCWIEDYPLPDELKMPSYIGSYDIKWDPDNFLHLFEGAIHMQKWLMPVTCHMFTYTLKDSARIWWNSQRAVHNIKQREGENTRAFITRYTDDTLQILDFPSTYKGIMEKAYTWVEAREVATNGVLNNRRDDYERSKKFSRGYNIRQKDRGRFSPYKGQNHKLLSNLVKSPREILAIEKVAKTFEQPPRLPGANWSKDKTRSLRVDSNIPLVGFSGEQSWPLGEIPLEITFGEGPIVVTKTLTFVIVTSDSPHNLLLGRTAMQQMWIVVSTVHGVIKFHTPRGIGTIFLEYNSQKHKEEEGGSTNKYQENEEIVLSCIDTEERVVINDKYPELKITIGRQLPTRIKIRLRDLLKKYIDVFA
ncbi:hypothetical protein Tco_0518977 [Tanacetum coccineum]